MSELSKYAASCVRVHGMRDCLLSREDWQRFLQAGSAAGIISQLYHKNLVSSASLEVREAEKEIRGNVIKAAEKIMRFVPRSVCEMLAFFIYYFDLINLETVITRLHRMNEDMPLKTLLYDTGRFGLFSLSDLTEINNFIMLEELLKKSFFSDPFNLALGFYKENEILADFLASLEFAFLDQWRQIIGRVNRLKTKDIPSTFEVFLLTKSVMSAMRLKFARKRKEYDVQRFIGVSLQPFSLKTLRAAMEIDEPGKVFHNLTQTIFPKSLAKKLEGREIDIKLMEIRLKELILETARKHQLKSGFSAEYLISFQFIKMVEADNIITLLECKNNHMDIEEAKNYLVGVT